MKKYLGILFIMFLLLPTNVFADSFSMSLSCPEVVRPSQSISCSLNIDNIDFTINKLSASYSKEGDITIDSSSLLIDNVSISDSTTVGSININIPSDASSNTIYKLNINSIIANESISTNNISKSMRVISSDTSLSDISITDGTLIYDSGIYSAVIDSPKTTISASAKDPLSRVTGTGEKILDYGKNEFEIKVISESGLTKSYNVNITRIDNRSKNSYLSSLFVTNTDIDFVKTKTEYNLSTNSSEVLISATKEDTKATVTGDTGKKPLNYGLNTFSIKVIAENGTSKTYKLNITRNDLRSNNNYLKTLTISDTEFKFNKSTTTYNLNVDKSIEKVKINATLDDNNSKFVNGFSPREVNLNLGNNIIYIKVQNQKSEIRTYTLNINRDDGRDSDCSLNDITLSKGNINFKSDIYEYKVNVEYSTEKIKIYAKASSDKAKVTIDGNEKLKVGNNIFIITVEAENGAKSEYKITINRKKEGYKLSSNNYIRNIKIKDSDINFNKTTYDYVVSTNKDKLNLSIKLDDEKASYKIIGNKNLKNNSKVIIRVTSEDGNIRDYTITVEKTTNMIIILLIIFTTLLAGALIYFVILNIIRKNKLRNMYKTKVEIVDEDFIGV